MKTLTINVNIDTVDKFQSENTIARIYYPNEGNKIIIKKGLNTIELSEAIFHEIGHLIDYYISNENQSNISDIRENNANIIGDGLRFRTTKLN